MRQSGERYALGDDMPSRQPGARGLQQASEYIAFAFHGVLITHLDSLGHIFWNGQMYNGISSASVASIGAIGGSSGSRTYPSSQPTLVVVG